jgi:hypothetical protein
MQREPPISGVRLTAGATPAARASSAATPRENSAGAFEQRARAAGPSISAANPIASRKQ